MVLFTETREDIATLSLIDYTDWRVDPIVFVGGLCSGGLAVDTFMSYPMRPLMCVGTQLTVDDGDLTSFVNETADEFYNTGQPKPDVFVPFTFVDVSALGPDERREACCDAAGSDVSFPHHGF